MLRLVSTFVAVLLLILGVAGCGVLTPIEEFDYDALEFEAEAEVVGDTVRYTLLIENTSDEDVTLTAAECGGTESGDPIVMRLYDLESAGGALRWDSNFKDPGAICTLELIQAEIRAGQQASGTDEVEIEAILGDSIAPGTYDISVAPNFKGLATPEISVGSFEIRP